MSRVAEQNQKKAKEILQLFGENGQHWAKDSLAYDKPKGGRGKSNADTVGPRTPQAQSWCLVGACMKLGFKSSFLDPFVDEVYGSNQYGVMDFNDDDGWSPIKNLLKRIIKDGTPPPKVEDHLD